MLVVVVRVRECAQEGGHRRIIHRVEDGVACILKLVSIPQLRAKLERAKMSAPVVVPGSRESALQVQLGAVGLADIEALQVVMAGIVNGSSILRDQLRPERRTGVYIEDYAVERISIGRGKV